METITTPPRLVELEQHDTKLLLTVDEAAAAMSLGRTLLYRMVMRGGITSIKVGRTRRVPIWSLREYVRRQLESYGTGA